MNICTEKQSKFSQINSKGRVRTAVAKQIYKPQAKGKLLLLPSSSLYFFLPFSWRLRITLLLKQSQTRQPQKWCLLIFYVLYKCWYACPENWRCFLGVIWPLIYGWETSLTTTLCVGTCSAPQPLCGSNPGLEGLGWEYKGNVMFIFFKHTHMRALFFSFSFADYDFSFVD